MTAVATMDATRQARGHNAAILISYLTFIGLGLSAGLLGIAIPSMRDEFGFLRESTTLAAFGTTWPEIVELFRMSLAVIGVLAFFQTLGYIVSSAISGRVMATLGSGRAFLLSAAIMGGGLLGFTIAPSWWIVIACGFLNGFGSGLLDAGLNSYVAMHYNSRQMNWLHACFGIGVTIGPVLMTQMIERDLSWRVGYAVTGVVMLAIGAMYLVNLRIWRDAVPESSDHHPTRQASMLETLRSPLMWLSVALFVVYAGMEIGVGNLAFTLFTEGRGIAAEAAGYWVAIYWLSFTIGRIIFGMFDVQKRIYPVLRVCMVVASIGALLLWLNVTEAVGFFGLALLGFAQAPLFPLLVLKTADRVGVRHASNAVGLQVSGAGIGVAVLPGIIGAIAAVQGLSILAPFFFAMAIGTLVIHEIAVRLGPREKATA